MSFADDLARFKAATVRKAQAIHAGVVEEAFTSIVEGSPLTGAPGQPVQTGNLKGSWQTLTLGPLSAEIMTNVIYAPQIEEGSRGDKPLTLRSPVGGFHSVALTRLSWDRIVEQVTKEVTR